MAASWHFERRKPGDTTRDPVSGEFFSTEAIRDGAEALIREGIQNSLDAAEGRLCRIRIVLGEASAEAAAPFLNGLWPHIQAERNGLSAESRPTQSEPVRFLAFEDFGTRGLQGDPLQWHHVEERRNGFYAFFRAEGETDKGATDRRGRWGIGKFAFPRTSRARMFFGLTARVGDSSPLLLGRAILKSHAVDELYYVPDGYYGIPHEVAGQGRIIAPIRDDAVTRNFAETFQLERRNEPGLSIVVPWPEDDITLEHIFSACARDWFYSIIRGELQIDVIADGKTTRIDASSLEDCVRRLGADMAANVAAYAALEKAHIASSRSVPTESVDVTNAPKWPTSPLSPDAAKDIRDRLESGEAVVLSVCVPVKSKRFPVANGQLDIVLQRDATADDGRPLFIREGIIVTDAKGVRVRGVRSIVIANRGPLADLLGDAENPAHTEWRPDTGNFKDKYIHGPGYLKFVREAVSRIFDQLDETEDDRAPDLLLNYFSLPEKDGPKRPVVDRPQAAPGPTPPNVPPLPEAKPQRFRVSTFEGGFALVSSGSLPQPEYIDVSAAYDVRSGSPMKRFHPSDFQFFKSIKLSGTGLEIESREANSVRLRVKSRDYRLKVEGFDPNRDLIVKATPKGAFDDDAPN